GNRPAGQVSNRGKSREVDRSVLSLANTLVDPDYQTILVQERLKNKTRFRVLQFDEGAASDCQMRW
ncbi:MAG: hypothetical protein ACI814_003422, partial [Mariniblastus sp.]